MPPTKSSTPIKATRIIYTSTTPFSIAESRLRSSIQKNPSFTFATDWSQIMKPVSTSPNPAETFTSIVQENCIGPHSFMLFAEFDHGAWLPIFDVPTIKTADGSRLKAKRFILGNPLIALGMLRWDLNAGLYVPTELILVEEESGGCRIVYQVPSGLIAGSAGAGRELVEAAKGLDGKLEELVADILRD